MPFVTPIVNRRLENEDKTQSAQLRKGVRCELPKTLFNLYKRDYGDVGVDPVGTAEAEAPAEAESEQTDSEDSQDKSEDETLLVIASAIAEIMEEGDPKKLTSEGDVRTDALSDLVGFKVTSKQRDAAAELA